MNSPGSEKLVRNKVDRTNTKSKLLTIGIAMLTSFVRNGQLKREEEKEGIKSKCQSQIISHVDEKLFDVKTREEVITHSKTKKRVTVTIRRETVK